MSACPSRADLQKLVANRLAPDQERPVLAHVETCPACQETLEELTADCAGGLGRAASGDGVGPPGEPDPAEDSFWRGLKAAVPRWASTLPPGPRGGLPTGRKTSEEAVPLPARLGRYELLEEIGRGGMGVVLRGRDPDLGRDLAVKVLRPDHQHDPAVVSRFTEEAQIGGQLQHPGIVPVYDVSRSAGQRPYFTMKLVKGQTLATMLQERASPADDLPRFLGIFEQVCQTLAYAHSKSVLHRDLKPSNIMVGAFGEVQVMDWGLAKVLRPTAATPAPVTPEPRRSGVRTVRSHVAGAESQAGAALGTPAYMAPEQARGEVDRLDGRTDVFGLGAMLCEILTGQPPFTGRSANEVLARAMGADVADAFHRLDACGAEAALVRLARECLAADPEARPRDAGVVAAAVTAYQHSVAQRLRRAELQRAEAQVQAREERKRRWLTALLAGAGVALVLLAAGGGLWLERIQAERLAEAARHEQALRQDIEASLAQAVSLRQGFHFEQGRALLELAQQRLDSSAGPDDLRRRVEQARKDLTLTEGLDAARLRAAAFAEDQLDFAGSERQYAAAVVEAGLGRKGDDVAAVAARVRQSAVRAEIVAALDDWASLLQPSRRRTFLLAVAREVDPDPWRDQLRQPEVWDDRAALTKLALKVKEVALSPQLATALGRALDRSRGDAVPLLAAAQTRFPQDFWLNFELAGALYKARRCGEAVGYYRAALALRPQASMVHYNLGAAQIVNGQLDEAIDHLQQALRGEPKSAGVHYNLGLALHAKRRLDEAIDYYRQALHLNPGHVLAHGNLGVALYEKGRLDEAINHCRKALDLDPTYAPAHNTLGVALKDKGRVDEAIDHYRKAINLDSKEALPHSNLGIALKDKGQLDEAIDQCQQALDLDPKLAKVHAALAEVLPVQGRFREAQAAARRCLDLLPQDDPQRAGVTDDIQCLEQLHAIQGRLPAVLQGQDKPADAAEHFQFAELCRITRHYAAALRLYAGAFTANAELADDFEAGRRYNAACAAVLAAAGQDVDAATVGGTERTHQRRQALDWLQADLAAWAKAPDRALVQRTLWHWQQDFDLASVRDQEALAKFPSAERDAWTKFWSDVADLLQQSSGKE
jgi:serine/threonine-protein kinase